MTIPYDETIETPLTTDEALRERVAELLKNAIRRQWWTLYLDEDDVQVPALMPMADYPLDPDEEVHAADGFSGTAAQLLATRLAELVELIGASTVVFVWERPGRAESTAADRAWARRLAEACRAEGVRVRGQLILHDRGVRWFAPDDYA